MYNIFTIVVVNFKVIEEMKLKIKIKVIFLVFMQIVFTLNVMAEMPDENRGSEQFVVAEDIIGEDNNIDLSEAKPVKKIVKKSNKAKKKKKVKKKKIVNKATTKIHSTQVALDDDKDGPLPVNLTHNKSPKHSSTDPYHENEEIVDKFNKMVPAKSYLSSDAIKIIEKLIPSLKEQNNKKIEQTKIGINRGKQKDLGANDKVIIDDQTVSDPDNSPSDKTNNSTANESKNTTDDKNKSPSKNKRIKSGVANLEFEYVDEPPHAKSEQVVENAYKAYQMGQIEASVILYQEALLMSPDDTNALLGLATILHSSGQLDEARSLYTKVLTLEPSNYNALNNFLALVGDESPEEAILELKKLEAVSPNMSSIPAQIAMIYSRLGDLKKAIKYLTKALSLDPKNTNYKYNLAILYDKNNQFKHAVRLYRQVIQDSYYGTNLPISTYEINQRLTYLSAK